MSAMEIPKRHERFDRMERLNRRTIWDWSINADSIIDLVEYPELRRCKYIKIYHDGGTAKYIRLKKDTQRFLMDEALIPFYMEHPTEDGKSVLVKDEEVGDLENCPMTFRLGKQLGRRGPRLILDNQVDHVVLIADYPMFYRLIKPFLHIRKI